MSMGSGHAGLNGSREEQEQRVVPGMREIQNGGQCGGPVACRRTKGGLGLLENWPGSSDVFCRQSGWGSERL